MSSPWILGRRSDLSTNKSKTQAAIRRLKDLVSMDAPPRMIYRQLVKVFQEVNEFCFPPGEAECEVALLPLEALDTQDAVIAASAAESGTDLA